MIKEVRSWSKPDNLKNIIGRKKIDFSMFEYGTSVPKDFYEDFNEANQTSAIIQDKKKIELIYKDRSYEAALVMVQRKDHPVLQIRYDSNKELKALLIEQFQTSYKYILANRDENSKKAFITPPEIEEFIEFYMTDQPFVYEMNFLTKKVNKPIQFWWVNQGQTHAQERDGGYLWAPQQSKQGRPLSHHVDLVKAKKGDLVFCYSAMHLRSVAVVEEEAITSVKPSEITSQQWQDAGYLLKVKYFPLNPFINKDRIPIDWRKEETGPFDVNGNVKQGYFFTVSDGFVEKLFDQFKEAFPDEIKNILIDYKVESNNPNNQIKENKNMTYTDLTTHIHSYIKSKGFFYSKEEVINLFLSLKSKPFVILSGISGTGKTKMVQWFAESVGANEKNGQLTLIPVRPDWNDGSDLLGYVDIKGEFKEGPLTKVIKRALDKPHLPHFILLDEMNLARVEHYFSDLLSVMESRKWQGEKMVTSTLLSKEITGWQSDLTLPSNLYVIGTVNMDETTHPFSKKVLDRANTIEFNRVELSNLSFLDDIEEMEPQSILDDQFRSKYLHLKDVYAEKQEIVKKTTEVLEDINKALQLTNAHVGYRVRDEICFYLAYNEEGRLLKYEEALDHCILQKILPRISGSDTRVEKVLLELYCLFTNKKLSDDQEANVEDIKNARYPKSTTKVLEMIGRLRDDGFTSFWIS
ncbi:MULTISPECIES: McrB family protein [Bacillus]|uniref:McrB family protein n=1 Tax=Bacillus TaxID=1386 RepID=UPI0003155E97|nr:MULTISPECIES: AAA family ATPase [Bacillus]